MPVRLGAGRRRQHNCMLFLHSLHFFGAWNNVLTLPTPGEASRLRICVPFARKTSWQQRRGGEQIGRKGIKKEEGTDHKLNI